MNILFNWDDSVTNAPAGYDIADFKASIMAAGAQLDSLFSNNITLTIDVGLGEIGGTPIPGYDLSEGGPAITGGGGTWIPYAEAISELKSHTTNQANLAQLATLPSTAPTGMSYIFASAGEEKAWGLTSPNSSEVDGDIGFSTQVAYSPVSDRGISGEYDLQGMAIAEIAHAVLGKIAGTPIQLVNYASPGVLEPVGVSGGYFSLDGGVTNLGDFSQQIGVDWNTSGDGDPLDTYADPGIAETNISAKDLALLSWLGFDNTPGTPSPPVSTPPTSTPPTSPPTSTPPTSPPTSTPPVSTPPTSSPPTQTPPISTPPTPTPTPPTHFSTIDETTGQSSTVTGDPYTGPVADLQWQLINISPDNLNISATAPNAFIHSGAGEDALQALSGTNVMDGGTGSNFLVGGSGTDTFFVDDRNAPSDIWSTMVNFHTGDAATVWGVTPQDFQLAWVDGQGAAGYTGLTLHATAAGKATASLTLAGMTTADLHNGTLTTSFGTIGGSSYMEINRLG
jgi:hypothetical protein